MKYAAAIFPSALIVKKTERQKIKAVRYILPILKTKISTFNIMVILLSTFQSIMGRGKITTQGTKYAKMKCVNDGTLRLS